MNRDQNDVAPEVTLGSAVIRIPQAFLETVRTWQAGELEGRALYAGSDEAVVEFVINPATRARIPAELRDRVDAAADSIREGTLEVPRVAFVEGEAGG
jgi:basic membrane lipoprotein Med (substrate-binding protein (PBP1-ABC) superfamily)